VSNAYSLTERAFDLLLAGKLEADVTTTNGIETAAVSGECPYCGHDVNYQQVRDAIAGESPGVLGEARPMTIAPEYVTLTVSCQCAYPHAGRPEEHPRSVPFATVKNVYVTAKC
jgi:hypothetical protein